MGMTVARIIIVVLERPLSPLLVLLPTLFETELDVTERPPTDPDDKVFVTLFCRLTAAVEPGSALVLTTKSIVIDP